jgi:DNA-damage-inducible protein J
MEARTTTSIKLDPTVKANAKTIFNNLGMTMSDAINIFLKQVEIHHGMPFDIKIPNNKTIKAMKEAKQGIDIVEFDIEEFKKIQKSKK